MENLIQLSIQQDPCLQEWCFERNYSFQPMWVLPKAPVAPATTAPVPQITSMSEGEPMQIGLLRPTLTPEERACRQQGNLYLDCGTQATSFTTSLPDQVNPVYYTLGTSSYPGLYPLISFSPSHYRWLEGRSCCWQSLILEPAVVSWTLLLQRNHTFLLTCKNRETWCAPSW